MQSMQSYKSKQRALLIVSDQKVCYLLIVSVHKTNKILFIKRTNIYTFFVIQAVDKYQYRPNV